MNEIDMDLKGRHCIENICHDIYNDYIIYQIKLEKIKYELLSQVEKIPGIHLQTSRVKEINSLLCKVIEKRYSHMLDNSNLYSDIRGDNYRSILTDLIGIRLIISYRGKWLNLHNSIINIFPYYDDKDKYNKKNFIPHPIDGSSILAEIPKVYYAYGDDVSIYEGLNLDLQLKENGYRSVHYVVSFKGVYVEI